VTDIKNELKIYDIFDNIKERKEKLFEIEDKNIMFDWIDDFND
jgi:hypothetical protein